MQKKQKKKARWQTWLVMGLSVLAGAFSGILMAGALEQNTTGDQSFFGAMIPVVLLFLGVYAGVVFQLIVHETGHLIFGLLSGYRFSSFRIGSFMWLKENGKIVCKRFSLVGTGGQCLMAPPEIQDGKFPVVLYNLGGCIMNLISGAVFFVIGSLTPAGTFFSRFFMILSIVGVAIALMNGIPLRLGTVDNDGRNALSVGKDPDAMRSFWLQLKVNEQVALGVRLKDMPDEWFVVPDDKAMGNSLVAVQGVFATNRLMDQQRLEEADRLIEHLLRIDSGIVGLHRSLMICDRVYCGAIRGDRREILDEMLTKDQIKFMKSMKMFPSVIRTEYAYALLVVKDADKADTARKLFEKMAKTYPYPGDVMSERELIEIADRENNKRSVC